MKGRITATIGTMAGRARGSTPRSTRAAPGWAIVGYAEVDDRLVWDVLETKLPALRREVDALLDGD
jgi:hypothetical protein